MPVTTSVGGRLIRASKVLFDKREDFAKAPIATRTELASVLDGIDGSLRSLIANVRGGTASSSDTDSIVALADRVYDHASTALTVAQAQEIREALRGIQGAVQLVAVRAKPEGQDQLGKLAGAAAVLQNLSRVLRGEVPKW